MFSEVGGGGAVCCSVCLYWFYKNDRKTHTLWYMHEILLNLRCCPHTDHYLMDNDYKVEVKGVRDLGKAKPGFPESCHLPPATSWHHPHISTAALGSTTEHKCQWLQTHPCLCSPRLMNVLLPKHWWMEFDSRFEFIYIFLYHLKGPTLQQFYYINITIWMFIIK